MENIRSKIKSISQYKHRGQVVLVRVDYNSEVENGKVSDNTRIKASLLTLDYLTNLGSRMVLISHRGRPKGRVDSNLTMKPQAEELAWLTKRKFVEVVTGKPVFPNYPIPHVVFYADDFRKLTKTQIQSDLNPGDILFLENIRFYPGEEELNEKFTNDLAGLGEAYINEAFSVDHHGSASLVSLAEKLPCFAGLRLIKEIEMLDYIVSSNRKPLVLIAGGAKMSDKIKMLEHLLPKSNYVLPGGGLANLFLVVAGYSVGKSLLEESGKIVAANLWRNYKQKITLPIDVVVAPDLDGTGEVKLIGKVGPDDRILDIGPQTIFEYSKIIKTADAIVWNGPLGVFEKKQFSHGTLSLARLIASRGRGRAFTLVGGGETLQALDKTQLTAFVDFVSTGGGAMLSYLGGEPMPGLESLVR